MASGRPQASAVVCLNPGALGARIGGTEEELGACRREGSRTCNRGRDTPPYPFRGVESGVQRSVLRSRRPDFRAPPSNVAVLADRLAFQLRSPSTSARVVKRPVKQPESPAPGAISRSIRPALQQAQEGPARFRARLPLHPALRQLRNCDKRALARVCDGSALRMALRRLQPSNCGACAAVRQRAAQVPGFALAKSMCVSIARKITRHSPHPGRGSFVVLSEDRALDAVHALPGPTVHR